MSGENVEIVRALAEGFQHRQHEQAGRNRSPDEEFREIHTGTLVLSLSKDEPSSWFDKLTMSGTAAVTVPALDDRHRLDCRVLALLHQHPPR